MLCKNENLLKAAEEGDLEEVVKLIEEGADIESRTTDFVSKKMMPQMQSSLSSLNKLHILE